MTSCSWCLHSATCDIPVVARWAHAEVVKGSLRISSWGRCENDCYRHVHVYYYVWLWAKSFLIIESEDIQSWREVTAVQLPALHRVKPADLQPGPFLVRLGIPQFLEISCNNIIFMFGNGHIVPVCYQITFVIRHFKLAVWVLKGLLRAGHGHSVIVSPNSLRLHLYRVSCINKRNMSFSHELEQLWENTNRIKGGNKIGQKSLVKFWMFY